MVSITCVLERIKEDVAGALTEERIARVCRETGLRWRERCLTPVVTVYAFLLQLLHDNTAMTNLPRLTGQNFTAPAYCQARQRLPLAALRQLLHETGTPLHAAPAGDDGSRGAGVGRWHGQRTFLVDGSSCSMPDTPVLRRHFGQPTGQKKGCGFPVAHLLVLFDAGTGMLLDILVSSWRMHDLTRMAELHPHLQPGDVLVGDRAFCSYAHVALLWQPGVFVVLRMRARQIVDFHPRRRAARDDRDQGRPRSTWLARLGDHDQLVLWRRPSTVSRTMTTAQHAALPEYVPLRELRYRVVTPGFRTRSVTLATTLLDEQRYSAAELAALYGRRWEVETNLRHLKQTLGLKVLKSQTVAGVEKEIVVFGLVYNLVRAALLQAAEAQGVAPQRISFVDALRYLRWPLEPAPGRPPERPTSAPLVVNPRRPGRFEPRVRKRRPPQYPLMTQPRRELRKALRRKHVAP
jgi:hypothetical protein